MRKRSRFVIALVLTLAAVIMPYGTFREGFLLNVVDFAVLMISGSSLLMFGAAGGIIWKVITEKSEQVQTDIKSLPLPEVASSTSKTVELLECGIEPDKQIFHRGESLWFRIRFSGTLRHGYRAAQATSSNGDILPIYDDKTLRVSMEMERSIAGVNLMKNGSGQFRENAITSGIVGYSLLSLRKSSQSGYLCG